MDDGPPLAPPGAAFHRSGTGYILIGEVIETVTGQSMPRALAELLSYRRLGVHHMWFETLEPAPTRPPRRSRTTSTPDRADPCSQCGHAEPGAKPTRSARRRHRQTGFATYRQGSLKGAYRGWGY